MANLKSQGCSFWMLDTSVSPNAYVQIGQVVSVSGPDGTTGEIDVTSLASTAKEFVPSLPDWGSVSTEVIWDYATQSLNHDDLWTDFSNQTTGSYQLRLSDSPQTTLTITGFPNQYSVSLGVDDKVTANISIRCTSAVTIA